LEQSEKINDEFDANLDGVRDNKLTNINIHPVENPYGRKTDDSNAGGVVHPLHSQLVAKLEKSSTTEDVVKAIKRAQNYHDMHDIREIAHFLLEEVGEYFFANTLCMPLYAYHHPLLFSRKFNWLYQTSHSRTDIEDPSCHVSPLRRCT
jgi:hypothetical protein